MSNRLDDLFLNTSNMNKLREFHEFGLKGLRALGRDLPEPDADPITVIRSKASQMGPNVIVEDTSLDVDGEDVGVNVKWLLDHLDAFVGKRASFRVLIGLLRDGRVEVYQGLVHGTLVPPQGSGFGFDPAFLPDGETLTFGEAKPARLNPRAIAVRNLIQGRTYRVLPPLHEWDGDWQGGKKAKYKGKKEVQTADGTATIYEYGPRQVSNRHKEKAERIEQLRQQMADLRKKARRDLDSKDPHTRLTALAVCLMDETFERVGNPESAENGHYGVTNWEVGHITFADKSATIKYVGKSGVKQEKKVKHSRILSALREAVEGKKKGDKVLCEGEDCDIQAKDVNEYLKGFNVTAKDIRGLHANELMRHHLKEIRGSGDELPHSRKEKDAILKEEFQDALELTADAVGHEPTTLRNQYLVPGMEDQYLHDGTVIDKLDKHAGLSRMASLRHTLSHMPREVTAFDVRRMSNLLRVVDAEVTRVLPLDAFCYEEDVERLLFAGETDMVLSDGQTVLSLTTREAPYAWATRMGTLTQTEKDEREADRLVKRSPTNKPPRRDRERRIVRDQDNHQPDADAQQDKRDKRARVDPNRVKMYNSQAKQIVWVSPETAKQNPDIYKDPSEAPENTPTVEDTPTSEETPPVDKGAEIKRKKKELTDILGKSLVMPVEKLDPSQMGEVLTALNERSSFVADSLMNASSRRNLKEKVEGARKILNDIEEGFEAGAVADALLTLKAHQLSQDPMFLDIVKPITSLGADPLDERTLISKEHVEEMAQRSIESLRVYRTMNKEDRSDHLKMLQTALKKVDPFSPQGQAMSAQIRGLVVASAIKDGDNAKGVNPTFQSLLKAADKMGRLEQFVHLNVTGAAEGDSTAQQQFRDVLSSVPFSEWASFLPEKHPAKELLTSTSKELSDPEVSKLFSPEAKALILEDMQDLILGEVLFTDMDAVRAGQTVKQMKKEEDVQIAPQTNAVMAFLRKLRMALQRGGKNESAFVADVSKVLQERQRIREKATKSPKSDVITPDGSSTETPPPVDNTPTPVDNTPPPVDNAPTPVDNTPPPLADLTGLPDAAASLVSIYNLADADVSALRAHAESLKGKGGGSKKSPKEKKKDFLENLDPSKYSPQELQAIKDRIRKMDPKDFLWMLSMMADDESIYKTARVVTLRGVRVYSFERW